MIKGVNRKVVEVSETDCEYFEKIMFFIKPEFANESEGKIRQRASQIANENNYSPPTKTKSKTSFEIIKAVGFTLFGIIIGILGMVF